MRFEDFEKGGVVLVETVMRRFDENTALMFTTEVDGRTVRHVVYRPMNYTQVWTDHPGAYAKWSGHDKQDRFVDTANGVRWSCIQNHDSCWTDWDCNVVGLDFMTQVKVLEVKVFTADPLPGVGRFSFKDSIRRGIVLTLVDEGTFPEVQRTGRDSLILSGQVFDERDAWVAGVFGLTLAYWNWKGHTVETLKVSFSASEYKDGRWIRMNRTLKWEAPYGTPVLVGVASDRLGEKFVPRLGLGNIQSDVLRYVVRPFKLAETPDRDFYIDLMHSKMDPKPYDHWPHG